MRDWRVTLRPGTYKGVPFHVEEDQGPGAGGRFVPVHTYVRGGGHDTEDLGRKARTYRFTAYVVGTFADAQALALQVALESEGAGPLSLPYFAAPQRVRVVSYEPSTHKDRGGYVGFRVECVEHRWREAGAAAGAGLSVAALLAPLNALRQAVTSVIGAVLAPLAAGLAVVGAIAGAVTSAISFALGVVSVVRSLVALIPDGGGSLSARAEDLAFAAERAATPEEAEALHAAATALLADAADAAVTVPADAAGEVFALFDRLRVAEPGPSAPHPRDLPGLAVAAASAALALGEAARLAAEITETAPRAAAPERIIARADAAIDAVARLCGADIAEALSVITDDATALIASRAAATAPLMEAATVKSLPAGVAAWLVTGDPDRAGELMDLNGVSTPLFMPTTFLARA